MVHVCRNCDPESIDGDALVIGDSRWVVLTHTPDAGTAYFTALHELGHHATLGIDTRHPTLLREASAWRWALEHTLIDPNRAVWADILSSLESYAANKRLKQIPEFDSLMDEARKGAT